MTGKMAGKGEGGCLTGPAGIVVFILIVLTWALELAWRM